MKTIKLLTFFILFLTNKIYSQYTSIESLEDCSICYQTGVYYKDLNNFLNTLEGTYLYNSNGTYFKIVLQKKEVSNVNDIYYEDILIGSYQYSKGFQSVNYLSELAIFHQNGWKYPIDGNKIYTGNDSQCVNCQVNEKWVSMSINDPITDSLSEFTLRKTVISGQEAIIVKIGLKIKNNAYHSDTPTQNTIEEPTNYPLGEELILYKQ